MAFSFRHRTETSLCPPFLGLTAYRAKNASSVIPAKAGDSAYETDIHGARAEWEV